PGACIDAEWWRTRIERAADRRKAIPPDTTAYRVVYAEAAGCPSLIVDRYGEYVVLQMLSAGIEACRADIVAAVAAVTTPSGILARNDASVRVRAGLPRCVELLAGDVPAVVEVRDHGIRYLAAPRLGQ